MFIIENDTIGLRQYTHEDDYKWYLCWKNIDTQKGYNGMFNVSFDDFCKSFDINRFRFWVTVIDKCTNESVGTLRLGLDEECPDLAIWIYPEYRNRGYGSASFKLALAYLFDNYDYQELSAGCYQDNIYSLKVLKKNGFKHHPEYDEKEIDCFTGNEIIQQEFRIKKNDFRDMCYG